jgi:phosphoglycerate dehydrogenase-like enzyme
MDELFQQSDIISLHCPLTDETRHMNLDVFGALSPLVFPLLPVL